MYALCTRDGFQFRAERVKRRAGGSDPREPSLACLAQARFPTLARARAEIELWRVDHNCERPHSALGYETPKTFGDNARRSMPPSAGAAAATLEDGEKRGARHRAGDGVENRIEVN